MPEINELKRTATQVRRDILRMVHAVNSGHPGGSLGCADFLTAMYFEVMNHDVENFTMEGDGQDMFFLSNGHISPLWYSVMARKGYFPVEELNTFRKLDTRLQGHPTTAEGLPGVRIASGSLGQGLSVATGVALSKRLKGDKGIVYCLQGDGELEEGQVWEAAMFAVARKVDNLIGVVDVNGQQIDGTTADVLALGDLRAKWEAFGWIVLEMQGNEMEDVVRVMAEAKTKLGQGKPVMVLMHTDMGHGVDFMCGTHEWHGKAPSDAQLENALGQLEETLGDY